MQILRTLPSPAPDVDSKDEPLPIRGFTAYDPDGYTPAFETLRDDPRNTKMRALLKAPK